jgi:hypothetical protein
MSFADCLRNTLKTAHPPANLKKSLAKAGLGLVGLAALPLLGGGGAFVGPALKMTVALAAACALAFFALRLLAQRSRTSAAEDLKVVARASLSPKNGVALLEADGQRYLVAFGDGFATLLSNAPKADALEGEPP